MTSSTDAAPSKCSPQDRRRVVAQNQVVTVEACSCGVVHLHFGPLSLRFTRSTLELLHRATTQATVALAQPDATTPGNWLGTAVPRGLA